MGTLTQTTAQVQAILNGQYSYTDGSYIDKQILRITNTDVNKAPFCLSVGDHIFNGVNDFWMLFGYNVGLDGAAILASEPSLSWNLESSYNNGVVDNVEYYLQWQSPVGLSWTRLIEYYFNKVTGALQSAAMTFPEMKFKTWEEVAAPIQVFATLGANDATSMAISYPAFKLLPLTNQTAASTIGATAGNSKQANLFVNNGTQIGYFTTVATGINISETSGGTISFSTNGSALSVTIRNTGILQLTKPIVQTEISAALTDGTPTDAEIDTATGSTPTGVGAGWHCTIKDNAGTGLLYRVESDGTDWFYSVMTKAI